VDEIVVFPPLTQDEIIQMVDMMVEGLEQRLKDKDMGIELTTAAKDLLATRGFDPVLGARPLRRTVQRELEDTLAEKMLFGELRAGQIVLVDVEGEGPEAVFTFKGTAKAELELPDAETVPAVEAGTGTAE
jgi:ATP-dependent Clp protease ATP-binding subunit ClpC